MKLKNVTVRKLINNGYHISQRQSSKDMDVYSKVIPIHKHNGVSNLFAEVAVLMPSKELMVDIFDNSRQIYAPYYNREWHRSHADFVAHIDQAIEVETQKINTRTPRRRINRS